MAEYKGSKPVYTPPVDAKHVRPLAPSVALPVEAPLPHSLSKERVEVGGCTCKTTPRQLAIIALAQALLTRHNHSPNGLVQTLRGYMEALTPFLEEK